MPVKNYTLLLFAAFAACVANAQVRINEYSAANWQQFEDNYGKTEDWIELYNAGPAAAQLGGWWLSDDAGEPQKWAIPAGTTLPAGGYLLFWCSGRDEAAGGYFHTNFKLTQTKPGEQITLAQPNGVVADNVPVEKTQVHHARCRQTDGGAAWRICTAPTPGESNNGTPQVQHYAETPAFSLAAGFYAGAQTVSISVADPLAVIRYTLDGTTPTELSPVYAGPVVIAQTGVLKARNFGQDFTEHPGFVQFATYFIDENDFSLVVVSVAADSLLDLANGDKDIRPVGSIEYFGQDNLLETRSYGELNSHGQDSWVNNQRSIDWISRDEMGYSKALDTRVFNYSDRDEYQRIILRASGDDNFPGNFLPAHNGCAHIRDEYAQTLAKLGDLRLDVRASERAVVFLNGEYWGVYGLREYPDDHDYTEYYHGQDKYDLQMLETWGETWAQYGGQAAFDDWAVVRDFILENDMSDSANYAQVKEWLNVTSLCDYFITGLTYVASDWINYNTAWWRGTNPAGDHKKWGYMLWDYDATFDYYINYSGVPNTDPDAQPCDIEDISEYMDQFFPSQDTCIVWQQDTFCLHPDPGKHEKIFLKLQDNAEFRQLYYGRQADLMNTVFSCDNMLHVLDSMKAVIEPEMPRHCQRWGGTMQLWNTNINKLRTFISQRCQLLDDGMVDCFDLTGPYAVVLQVEPPGAGEIDFNTLEIKNFPWQGAYFGNMPNRIRAKPADGSPLPFSHWVSKAGNTLAPGANAAEAEIFLTQPDTLIAVFGPASGTWETAGGLQLNVFPTLANENLTVAYALPETMPVTLTLWSALGERAADFPGENAAGRHTLRLDLTEKNLAPGVYWLDFQAGGLREAVKVTVVR